MLLGVGVVSAMVASSGLAEVTAVPARAPLLPMEEHTSTPGDHEPTHDATTKPTDGATTTPSDGATTEPSDGMTTKPDDHMTTKPDDHMKGELPVTGSGSLLWLFALGGVLIASGIWLTRRFSRADG